MGGVNAVWAEINLLRAALNKCCYDRLVFLQGADYPLKSNKEIYEFYKNNYNIEFVRACCVTDGKEKWCYDKCRYYLFYNNYNLIKKVVNKITRVLNLRFRDGYINDGKKKYKVYWGSAQWALTGKCAEYILEFHDTHQEFNKWFYHAFPADELYINTVIMNSPFISQTTNTGPEKLNMHLTNWRNLHYFEYLPGKIRVYTKDDYVWLSKKTELYIRKVNSFESKQLIEILDQNNS